MVTRLLKWFSVSVITFLLIEEFRVKYYYRIWNHPDLLILAVALAELPADNNMKIVDAVGLDPKWLSSHFLFSIRDLENCVWLTNVYRGPFNEITTKVEYASGHRFWNTDAWEVAARYQFKNSAKWQPEYAEILSILRDEPAVQKSKRLYTAADSVTVALFQVDEAVRFIQQQEKELKKYLAETPSTDAASIKFKRWVAEHRIASHKSSIVSLTGSLGQAFFVLYG